MRIGLLNRSDLDGGAGVAASRLFKEIKKNGVNVKYLVGIKHGKNDSAIIHYKGSFFTKLRNYFEKLILNGKNSSFAFSLNIVPFPLKLILKYHGISIVHFHWIGAGFISVRSLTKINKPIVWTMHDSWAFTGGCHVPLNCQKYLNNCGACPQLNSSVENDISRKIFNLKNKKYKQIENLTFISPSNWLAEIASRSTLLSNSKIIVIPNGIDTEMFYPKNKIESRALFNIRKDINVVVFGAVKSTSDTNKGYNNILAALNLLMDMDFEILIFGAEQNEVIEIAGKKAHFIKRIWDEDLMASLYSAGDLTIVPSMSETLSYVTMESLSCGTPVVAFKIGGIPDLIDHKLNGYLAEPYDAMDLANGVRWVFDQLKSEMINTHARKKITNSFDIKIVAKKHLELYNSILND